MQSMTLNWRCPACGIREKHTDVTSGTWMDCVCTQCGCQFTVKSDSSAVAINQTNLE